MELAAGEFDITQVVDSNSVVRQFTWGTGSASKYSLLSEYDKAGNATQDPTFSTGDMPYDDLMSDDSAQMGEDLQNRGNKPPYNATGVNADSQWVKVATLSAGAAQRLSTGFFKAPCGIVLITAGVAGTEVVTTGSLSWTVKSGDYKGVHAPSLLE